MQAPALVFDAAVSIDGVRVFDRLAFEAPAGKWTCLLGSSGVGKSTILKLFAGLSEGIEIAGHFGASDGDLPGRVTLMAQDDLLLPWLDVWGNVTLGARLRGEAPDATRARDVLAQVGLGEKARSKPHDLSGGQRQRAALARTLMEDRPVVLLDEPFSALDARTRAQMQDLTVQLLQGCTVLLVTHDPAEAVRLGHVIKVMGRREMRDIAPPAGPIPRPVDDPGVLEAQGRLLRQLRAADTEVAL